MSSQVRQQGRAVEYTLKGEPLLLAEEGHICLSSLSMEQRGRYKHKDESESLLNERMMNGDRIQVHDVLSGRGKLSFNHGGNKRFRDAVTNSLEQYMKSESRFEKSIVVHSIIDIIHRVSGRFLKKDFSTGLWYEMSRQQCKEKVGHAIRDAVNSLEARKKKKDKVIEEEGYNTCGRSGISPNVQMNINQMNRSISQKRRFSVTPVQSIETDYSSSHRKRRRTAQATAVTSMTTSVPLKSSPIQPQSAGMVARMPPLRRSPIECYQGNYQGNNADRRSVRSTSSLSQVFSFDMKPPPQQRDDFQPANPGRHHQQHPTTDNFDLAIDAVLGPIPSDLESPTNPSP